MDFYKIVEDENEMKWFFDHVKSSRFFLERI